MAYTKKVEGRAYPHLYNVEMGVGMYKKLVSGNGSTSYYGYYQPNKKDDVMLVQYLLKRVYQKGALAEPPLKGIGNGNPADLKIDGMWGPKTQSAIETFQIEMRRNGRNIATDGVVDSEKGESSEASISGTGYSISWLNKYFYVLCPELFPVVPMDPECPPELRFSLSRGFGY